MTLDEMINKFVLDTLQKNKNNKSATARELNITRKTLLKRLNDIIKNNDQFINLPKNSNDDKKGYFYIIQLLPDDNPSRIKLGYTSKLSNRLKYYKTACPNCKLLQFYPCKKDWEKTIIDRLSTITGASHIKNEVFDFHFLDNLLKESDTLFKNMPKIIF